MRSEMLGHVPTRVWHKLSPLPDYDGEPFIAFTARFITGRIEDMARRAGVRVEVTNAGIFRRRFKVTGSVHNLEIMFNDMIANIEGFERTMRRLGQL